MLQPSPAHFALTTAGGFTHSAGGATVQPTHNFIPVYFQSAPALVGGGGGAQAQLKQDSGLAGMTFQFQPQQWNQMLQAQQAQQQGQPGQGGRTVYQLNIGDNGAQYQVARMASPMQLTQQQQSVGKGKGGGRKATVKDDKVKVSGINQAKLPVIVYQSINQS